MHTATAQACANIAFVKYWGDLDPCLRIPANGSLSMNLAELVTRTRVVFDPALQGDRLTLDGQERQGAALERVSALLERVRHMAGINLFAEVNSRNNFPMGAGIASSASAFAALSLAVAAAAGLQLSEKELSRLARTASGSACRSIPGGFVEWQAGQNDEESFAFSIAPANHWDIADCVAIVSQTPKAVGSTEGHALATTSPLQNARVADAARRLAVCRRAICERDFAAFADIVELDSNLMHAVMMTSTPPLLYWQAPTVDILHSVAAWRRQGWPVCYTIDAGPNVHVLCLEAYASRVAHALSEIPGVLRVLTAHPGGAAHLLPE